MPSDEETTALETIETKQHPMKLSDVGIETIRHNMMMAEKLVFSLLEEGVDYGRLPGTPQPGLWEPGADKIMNGWNCYALPEVLHHVEEDGLISYTILSKAISRETQQIVATGIGACSTRETKYKYRWVQNPEDYGYSPEEIKTLKTKEGRKSGTIDYRILNPEYGELVNTMAKMAKKRADVAAAQELPGVSSALRKLFTGGKPQAQAKPNWASFWNQVSALGLSEDDVHQMLAITSMKDWLAQGKSLDQAIEALADSLADRPGPATAQDVTPKPKRDPETIKNIAQLYSACFEDFKLQPKDVLKELGYSSQTDISERPADCYRIIAEARG